MPETACIALVNRVDRVNMIFSVCFRFDCLNFGSWFNEAAWLLVDANHTSV